MLILLSAAMGPANILEVVKRRRDSSIMSAWSPPLCWSARNRQRPFSGGVSVGAGITDAAPLLPLIAHSIMLNDDEARVLALINRRHQKRSPCHELTFQSSGACSRRTVRRLGLAVTSSPLAP